MIRSTPIHSALVFPLVAFSRETAICNYLLRALSRMLNTFLIKLSMLFRDFSSAIHWFKSIECLFEWHGNGFFLPRSKLIYARQKVASSASNAVDKQTREKRELESM